ncbi:MAG: glycosyltransferase family 2 protein [Pseudomonadota bacterium]
MSNHRVSVVTISFNQATFLERAIRSVIDQNVDCAEYIVVDPGSTDGSRDIIERYRARINTVILDKDRGPADGLNKGFAASTGDIFAYVNADDELAPGSLAFALAFMDGHPEVDVLNGAVRVTDANGRPKARKICSDLFNLRDYATGICTIGQQATFIRRSAFEKVGGFNIQNRCFWDGELLVDLAIAGARFCTVNKVLGDYRIYPTSLTGGGLFASEKYRAEHKRVVEKIQAHGIAVDTGLKLKVRRWLYKLNMRRHLQWLLVQ